MQLTMLSVRKTITTPLLSELSQSLQAYMGGGQTLLYVLQAHHHIRALGGISKGFPDAPVPTPAGYVPAPWTSVFKQVAEAILVSLEAMNGQRLVRDAVSISLDLESEAVKFNCSELLCLDPVRFRPYYRLDRGCHHTIHSNPHDSIAHPVRAS